MLKKTVILIILVGVLGTGIGATAATMTLKEKSDDLKNLYGQSVENYRHDREEQGNEEEIKRLETETRAYFSQKLQEKKEQEQTKVKAETDQYIKELDKYIDQLLTN